MGNDPTLWVFGTHNVFEELVEVFYSVTQVEVEATNYNSELRRASAGSEGPERTKKQKWHQEEIKQ